MKASLIFALFLLVAVASAVPVPEEAPAAAEAKTVEAADAAPADDLKTEETFWVGHRPYYGGWSRSYYTPYYGGWGGYGGYGGWGGYGGYRRNYGWNSYW